MREYIKNTLGVKALQMGTIASTSTTGLMQEFDIIDSHAYWHHPSFPVTSWDMSHYYVDNTPLVQALDGGTPDTSPQPVHWRKKRPLRQAGTRERLPQSAPCTGRSGQVRRTGAGEAFARKARWPAKGFGPAQPLFQGVLRPRFPQRMRRFRRQKKFVTAWISLRV